MRVAYVGPFSAPCSQANSLRVLGVATALTRAGVHVDICGYQHPQVSADAKWCMPGLDLYSVNEYSSGAFSQVSPGVRGLFIGDQTLAWIDQRSKKPDSILLYGTHIGYLTRLLPYCRRHGIRLYLDVVEWYDPRHLPGGILGPFAICNEISMRFLSRGVFGAMVISRYLEAHYRALGVPTIRIPPLFSSEEAESAILPPRGKLLRLCYVGSPGAKEEMAEILRAVADASSEGIALVLHLVGLSSDELAVYLGSDRAADMCSRGLVICHGRVENSKAREIVAGSHFLILLRRRARFSQAGFPSKVVESLCVSTPVICNISSDLGDYLEDGLNSLVVESPTAESLVKGLRRASLMSEDQRLRLRLAARSLADRSFRPEIYSDSISSFLSGEA